MLSRIEKNGDNGATPPGSPWKEVASIIAEGIDRYIGELPVVGQVVAGYGGLSNLVHGLFSREARPKVDQPAYISASDVERLHARSGDAAVVANNMQPGRPTLVLSIDKVGKSQLIEEVAQKAGRGTVFKIIMEPVVGKRWSKMEFEAGFRESLANAMAAEIEARGGSHAREVLPYIRASMKRSKKDVMAWLETWLQRHGYSAAVIAVHEAILWKPEYLAEKLEAGRKRISAILEYHNYAVNRPAIEAAFPQGLSNEYHYIGFLPEASLVLYVKRFQELNLAFLRPISSRLGEYIYLVTGGWLEAVNFILEEVSDPRRHAVETRFPKEITMPEIAQAARRFVLVEGGVDRLRAYLKKLGADMQKALADISCEKIMTGELSDSMKEQLTGMGLVHEGVGGDLELSGSILEAALSSGALSPVLTFPTIRPVR